MSYVNVQEISSPYTPPETHTHTHTHTEKKHTHFFPRTNHISRPGSQDLYTFTDVPGLYGNVHTHTHILTITHTHTHTHTHTQTIRHIT